MVSVFKLFRTINQTGLKGEKIGKIKIPPLSLFPPLCAVLLAAHPRSHAPVTSSGMGKESCNF